MEGCSEADRRSQRSKEKFLKEERAMGVGRGGGSEVEVGVGKWERK